MENNDISFDFSEITENSESVKTPVIKTVNFDYSIKTADILKARLDLVSDCVKEIEIKLDLEEYSLN